MLGNSPAPSRKTHSKSSCITITFSIVALNTHTAPAVTSFMMSTAGTVTMITIAVAVLVAVAAT
jgi:hypothetical protein